MRTLLAFIVALTALSASAASIQLAWDRNSETNVTSYRVYYGTASRAYTIAVNVGNATTFTVTNLAFNTTYFFAATAVDTFGRESAFSVEASGTTPLPPLPPPPVNLRITNILQSASSSTGPWKNVAKTVYEVPADTYYRERMTTPVGTRSTSGLYVEAK